MSIFKDTVIIIPTFKSDKIIGNCINKLDKNFKILIIENSNRKFFKKKIEDQFINTKVILVGYNSGWSNAANVGIKFSKEKFILFLNPDIVIKKKSIQILLKTLLNNSDIGLVAPKTFNAEGEIVNQYLTCKNSNKKKGLEELKWLAGHVMFVKRKIFNNVGFFDKNIFLDFEDIDFCYRIRNSKLKVMLDLKASCIHLGNKSHDLIFDYKVKKLRMWHYGWSYFYFHKKHYSFQTAIISVWKIFFINFIKLVCYLTILDVKKFSIYKNFFLGYFNSLIGSKSFYRIKF
jgi:N-acetylglucosaminyl-diphospho-decaprenol L-rhamnosyltransferase